MSLYNNLLTVLHVATANGGLSLAVKPLPGLLTF